MTGIYKITNLINNKIYIGQAVDIRVRFKTHEKYDTPEKFNGSLTFEQQKNMPIHQAIMKYGLENFFFEIIEECAENELDEKEKYWINFYNCKVPNGYNIKDGGKDGASNLKGEECYLTQYKKEDIDEVKKLLLQGKKPVDIIKIFPSIDIGNIYAINSGKIWKDNNLTYPLNGLKGNRKYNSEVYLEIKEIFNNISEEIGKMKAYSFLAEKYQLSIRSIMRIVK